MLLCAGGLLTVLRRTGGRSAKRLEYPAHRRSACSACNAKPVRAPEDWGIGRMALERKVAELTRAVGAPSCAKPGCQFCARYPYVTCDACDRVQVEQGVEDRRRLMLAMEKVRRISDLPIPP